MEDDIPPIDAFSCHEVLHLAYVMADLFERHVLAHRAVQSDPVLRAKADEICGLVYDFYQAVGQLETDSR